MATSAAPAVNGSKAEDSGALLDFDTAAASLSAASNGKHADASKQALFAPSAEFVSKALVNSREAYDVMYKRSLDDPEGFWGDIAKEFYWHKKWESPLHASNFDLSLGPIHISWFPSASTNLCFNAVDRHVEGGRGEKKAILWEGNEVGVEGGWTYSQLQTQVCRIANQLKEMGVKRGDKVTIYLPMIPELPAAMLACARIGAVHSVVFAGFSAESLCGRLLDSQSRVLLTCSGVMRGTKMIELKAIVDNAVQMALQGGFQVSSVLVWDNPSALPRGRVGWVQGRDVWWQDAVERQGEECGVEWMGSEDPLFLLYTSGSTGTPKGVLHTTGGYMVGAATTFKYIFDYHEDDVFWCTADCGWITGHTYLTYGPLLNGATVVVFEGVPTHPSPSRCWEVVDKYAVTVFYTAPTAIRALMRCGDEWAEKCVLSSLRLLGSVGEPINPEAWRWYHAVIGRGRCPIVDTWWQTETGSILISPLPGAVPLKPGCAMLPFFGVDPVVLDEQGKEMEGPCSGYLAIKRPWPSCFRTVAGDHGRFESVYFSPFRGVYLSGDGCRRDEDGFYWLTGRVDDVINVRVEGSEALRSSLKSSVRHHIGAFATPDVIHWAPGLPKTRSGKIMRRILRKIAAGEDDALGDISTLADPSVVETLIAARGS